MQIRTEIEMRRLLDLWDGRQSAVLFFVEIRKALGWNSSRTTRVLKLAVSEGYLEGAERDGRKGYRNKMADYSGYFDGFEYLAEIDKHSRKSGKIQSGDQYLRMFSPLHLVEYGIPNEDELTPFERELAFTIRARFAHAFEDYTNLCEDIEYRQKLESLKKLPDSVRSLLFARDETKDKDMPDLSIKAAWTIYGDVLWEHIFENIIDNVRRMLYYGTGDGTGPIQLLYVHKVLTDATAQITKLIREGKASHYNDPDPATTERLQKLQMERDTGRIWNLRDKVPPDVAVVVTHSPRTMGDFSYQVGKIVQDQYTYWSKAESDFVDVVGKAKSMWDDKVKEVFGVTTRREAFFEALVSEICSMRAELDQPISDTDKKLMLKDQTLTKALTEDQILKLVERVRNLVGRAKKFRVKISEGVPPAVLVKDDDWFTAKEMDRYTFLDDRFIPPAYNAPKGGVPPVLPKFSSQMDDIIDELDRKWPQWKPKERSPRKKGQSGVSTKPRR